MPVKRRKDKAQDNEQLALNFEPKSAEPEAAAKPKRKSKAKSEPVQGQLLFNIDEDTFQEEPSVEQPETGLVPTSQHPLGFLETETVNALVAMAGLSVHTQRAYQRWIRTFLSDVNHIAAESIDLKELNIEMAVESISSQRGPANLKAWLGQLKARKLGKQSIMQAKASIVWLAQLMADIGRCDYAIASGLSRVKAPRAETGQREGTWLTQDEVRQLISGLRRLASGSEAALARNKAIVVLMVTCGLRRDEIITATWGDLNRQGGNAIIRVHGKGEKLRIVKLPRMTAQAIEEWRPHHPNPQDSRPIFTRVLKNGIVLTDAITDRAIWNVVRKAARLAGLPPVSPHDLRRSFARGAYEAGVSFELIRQALGHSNIATTERYVNSVLELDHAATDIWAGALGDDEDDE